MYIGDGNNIVASWLEFAAVYPIHFVCACPPGFEPDAELLARSRATGVRPGRCRPPRHPHAYHTLGS